MSHWWCQACKCEVLPQNVTYDEHHDNCGGSVMWINEEEETEVEYLRQEIDALKKQLAEKDEKARFADMVLKENYLPNCTNEEFYEYCYELKTNSCCRKYEICKTRAELLKKYPPRKEVD